MILPEKKYKIALVGYRLSEGGGDKVMANLSLFFEKQGIEIHNIIVLDSVGYSYSGKLVNLGLLKNNSNGFGNKLKRFLFLRKYLSENKFDFIIDFRPRRKAIQELIIARFIYKAKTIFTIHSFLIDYYIPKNAWLASLIYNKSYATLTIVKEIEELIKKKYQFKNIRTIPNPINLEEVKERSNETITIDFEYIIAIGQYENSIKQFDKLILSYANSILPKKEIHLIILGNGNKEILEKIAKDNNIFEYVHFLGFQENPFKYLKKALFMVLSSLNEGFPNVILEALACQTPVVAFDCKTGPGEMIIDKVNGVLVENQNLEKLTEAMNLLIDDKDLYLFCKKHTLESIQHFSLDKIGEQWLDLMQIGKKKNGND
ncbi:glycosyltransferase [Flavobacterium sp. 5]|uniref:glycosyltransferase n=1 Tax=Flavobacterium sp. 5 TaxID=2035199 RepID=UPI000C2CD2E4|nr:glycosyltransferase [Flavobacterium sp. 5]PKB15700.1 N-acetylgalactosamine-N,N'-diacetylbacillosaminyl-diphospho-undecaprenol 4-alpha-N-acetylgalactosaminyltransferase [Flavobacterium sp. 5]